MEETEIKKPVPYLQIIFLVVLIFAVGALVFTTITIIKYKNMLANPLGYNMDKYGLSYCTCYTSDGKVMPIKGLSYNDSFSQYIPIPVYEQKNYSIPKINFNST